jgi:Berberine and berberine like
VISDRSTRCSTGRVTSVPSSSGSANYGRLVTARRRCDPDNIFRLNHNIDPMA